MEKFVAQDFYNEQKVFDRVKESKMKQSALDGYCSSSMFLHWFGGEQNEYLYNARNTIEIRIKDKVIEYHMACRTKGVYSEHSSNEEARKYLEFYLNDFFSGASVSFVEITEDRLVNERFISYIKIDPLTKEKTVQFII